MKYKKQVSVGQMMVFIVLFKELALRNQIEDIGKTGRKLPSVKLTVIFKVF